jgi:hypothetical protein
MCQIPGIITGIPLHPQAPLNRTVTSDFTPSADRDNINGLCDKHPGPTHRDRDPTTQPASFLDSEVRHRMVDDEDGHNFLRKWFRMAHILPNT